MRRRTIALEDGSVAGVEYGPEKAGLDILFLHANGFNALTYRHVFAELDPSRRLLAVDLRGHGLTRLTVPAVHPGWQLYADDLVALIEGLGETPRLLAGHSMGGAACLLAARHLPRVEILMLFDPVIAPGRPCSRAPLWEQPMAQAALRRRPRFASAEQAFEAYDGRGAFRTWQDAMLHDYLQDGLIGLPDGSYRLACAPEWEAANFATFASADPVAGLVACAAPVTIFAAAHGSTCSLDSAALPAAVRRRVAMETLPGTSHFLPMERPGIVCKAMGEALKAG